MGSDRNSAHVDVLTGDPPDAREFPANRKASEEDATTDTLVQELTTVANRHDAVMSHAEITRDLFDFADTWAMVHDVEMELQTVEKPNGDLGVLVHYTGPRADDVQPSPVGKFYPDEMEQMGGDDV